MVTPPNKRSKQTRVETGSRPGLALADPAVHLGLLVVILVVGVVPPPGGGCDHGAGLTRGVIGGVFYRTTHRTETLDQIGLYQTDRTTGKLHVAGTIYRNILHKVLEYSSVITTQ